MTVDCTVGVGTGETKTDNTDVTGTDNGTGDGTVEAGADGGTDVDGTDVTGTDTEVDGHLKQVQTQRWRQFKHVEKTYWMDNSAPHAPVADTSGTCPSTGNHEAGDRIHGTQNKTQADQDARHEQDTK